MKPHFPSLHAQRSLLIRIPQPGDLVLSRPEDDPDAPVEARLVEETFERTGLVLELVVGGQLIRTTGEHRFWVRDRGWVDAQELAEGDLLAGHDGQWTAVITVSEIIAEETVYDMRVGDFHTYFVGEAEWGFSVWAHNANNYYTEALSQSTDYLKNL